MTRPSEEEGFAYIPTKIQGVDYLPLGPISPVLFVTKRSLNHVDHNWKKIIQFGKKLWTNMPFHYIVPSRRACGFQNLVGTSVYGGHNLSPLGTIGSRWKPKHGGDQSPCPQMLLWNLDLRTISACKFIYITHFLANPFSDSLLKSFLDKTTLRLRNKEI